jgi:hypothetical protein
MHNTLLFTLTHVSVSTLMSHPQRDILFTEDITTLVHEYSTRFTLQLSVEITSLLCSSETRQQSSAFRTAHECQQ